jgi:microcystin-dependent protein
LLAVFGLFSLLQGELAWAARSARDADPAPLRSSDTWDGATVPLVMNYQGTLHDAEGNPFTGYYTMTFRVYTDVIAPITSSVWSETHFSVTVRGGRFNVLLGNVAPISNPIPADLFNDPDRFVGVQVAGYDEMVPRQRFASVPYALHANYAADSDSLDGHQADELVPPGTVVAFGGETPPSGWLVCDGQEISRTQYAELFSAIGTVHGEGDGLTTFNLPDYRGRFLRGTDEGTGRDPDVNSRVAANPGGNAGDAVGSLQGDATSRPNTPFTTNITGDHNHIVPTKNTGGSFIYELPDYQSDNYNYGGGAPTTNSGNHSHTITGGGDNETRPVNAYVIWIIKY